MYKITCDGLVLYDPRDEKLIVANPKCSLEVNTVGGASFSIYATHPHYDDLKKKRSIFEILQDEKPIFRGRMTEDTVDFDNMKAIDLEGVMAFFNDSLIRPFVFPEQWIAVNSPEYNAAATSGNVVEYFLEWLIYQHNSQVQDFQKLKLGKVTVSDPNNYISRSSEEILTTWEVLKTRLFDSGLGGYLCIRYEDDGNYIDYLADFDSVNPQKVTFGENLLDVTNGVDASTTYSAVLPFGMRKNEIDKESEDNSRLTIEELGDGNITGDIVKAGDTIFSKSAVEAYGFIYAPTSATTWDDVSEAANLQDKAVDYLTNTAVKLSNTITIKAVDLHFSDDEIEAFRIYRYIDFKSIPHNLEGQYRLTQLEIDILNPQNTTITLGDTRLTMTDLNANKAQETDAKFIILKTEITSEVNKAIQSQTEEVFSSKIEQLAKGITLELSGSLGTSAKIEMNVGGTVVVDELDLKNVREAFAKDNSSVAISAGTITFNSGTLIVNSNNFKVSATGIIEATGAKIKGTITTEYSSYKAMLDGGGLELYYSNVLCGTINTKYWSGASTEGISLRIEEGGNYIMFSHADDSQGSGYVVDYYLNAGWSSNYDEMHIFQTSARFLSDAYFAGKTRIRSLRLFGSEGEYLVGIGSNGQLTVSKL